MYNARYIIPGIIIFVVAFTLPFWANVFSKPFNISRFLQFLRQRFMFIACSYSTMAST